MTTVPEAAPPDSGLELLLAGAALVAGLLAEVLELELLLEHAVTAARAATVTAASPAVAAVLRGISYPSERVFVFLYLSWCDDAQH
jgi:hypothetical protein